MLCLEVYRPDEMALILEQQENLKSVKQLIKPL